MCAPVRVVHPQNICNGVSIDKTMPKMHGHTPLLSSSQVHLNTCSKFTVWLPWRAQGSPLLIWSGLSVFSSEGGVSAWMSITEPELSSQLWKCSLPFLPPPAIWSYIELSTFLLSVGSALRAAGWKCLAEVVFHPSHPVESSPACWRWRRGFLILQACLRMRGGDGRCVIRTRIMGKMGEDRHEAP